MTSKVISENKKNVVQTIYKSDIFNRDDLQEKPKRVSDILQQVRPNNKSQIEFNLQDKIKNEKHKDVFTPKYKQEVFNPFERRVKEFYGTEIPSNVNSKSSVGHFDKIKSTNNTFKRSEFKDLSYKEKKILENNPELTKDNLKMYVENNDFNKEKAKQSIKNEEENKKGGDCKETYYKQMDSNIFFDNNVIKKTFKRLNSQPDMKKNIEAGTNKINQINQKTEQKDNKIQKNGDIFSCKLDWKTTDSKLHFNKRSR